MDQSFFDPEVAYEDTVLPDDADEVYRGREGVAAKIEGSEWMLIELEQIVGRGDRLRRASLPCRAPAVSIRMTPSTEGGPS